MERTFHVQDKRGICVGIHKTAERAWEAAQQADRMLVGRGPHTVVELVPVPRPVGPRPTATIGAMNGCFFKDGRLYSSRGKTYETSFCYAITAAAVLWERHQAWIAAGGKDDE